MMPGGYRIEQGLLWPQSDVGAAAVAFRDVTDLEEIYSHCRAFRVAVQAGGCCGVWPAAMGLKFETVYTFEPDAMNFRCLCANAPAENIYKFNAALGAGNHTVGMAVRPDNVGAHQVDGDGAIPTMLIDDLNLKVCDLICLDIEGYELRALHGAQSTIRQNEPVIVIEDKGCSERYGIAKGETEKWIVDRFGYRVAARIRRDVILVPA